MLPFHQMGKFKWEQLGIPYALEDVEPPSQEAVERACAVFRAAGLEDLLSAPRLPKASASSTPSS